MKLRKIISEGKFQKGQKVWVKRLGEKDWLSGWVLDKPEIPNVRLSNGDVIYDKYDRQDYIIKTEDPSTLPPTQRAPARPRTRQSRPTSSNSKPLISTSKYNSIIRGVGRDLSGDFDDIDSGIIHDQAENLIASDKELVRYVCRQLFKNGTISQSQYDNGVPTRLVREFIMASLEQYI